MSSHYTANQFNDSFEPKRLRNWRFGNNCYPGTFPRWPSCCPTSIIAGDNGHLFTHVPRNLCTSPWGDYRTSIWEEKIPCACVDMLRNPQYYTTPTSTILVTNEMPCPHAAAQNVCGDIVPACPQG